MDRRVAIVRFWLLCLAAVAVAVAWPESMMIWPVAFFTGQAGCFCCPTACSACTAGTALTPAQYQVEVSGMANDNCTDCAALDGTYIVDYFGMSGGDCFWSANISGASCDMTNAVIQFIVIGQVIGFTLSDPIAGAAGSWRQFQSFAAFDCDVTDYNLPVFGDTSNHVCDHTGSTCLMTAL